MNFLIPDRRALCMAENANHVMHNILTIRGAQVRDAHAWGDYLHQAVRTMNQGLTGIEIAERFELPPQLERAWHCRGYYGSVSHNVKAIYQRYLGWYDGNPARLHQHPPEVSGPKYVQAMGGVEAAVGWQFPDRDETWPLTRPR